jgi:hypothetical protein
LKYGKESFKKEILESCKDEKTLNERERHWIKELRSQDPEIGYNILEGGQGGDSETCSKNITAWWNRMSSEERTEFNRKIQQKRWANASEEQKKQNTAAAVASRNTESRRKTGKKVAAENKFWLQTTPEQRSERTRKSWIARKNQKTL